MAARYKPDPRLAEEEKERLANSVRGRTAPNGGLYDITERSTLLPFGKTASGQTHFAWPKVAVEALNAVKLPGKVMEGYDPTWEDIGNFALTMEMGGIAGSAPKGALHSGMARQVDDVADDAARATKKGIRAYHGSPHDFDKFELSDKTIGTGEGAQAYGHGLYLAENEGVARSYKNAGQPSYLGTQTAEYVRNALERWGGDRRAARTYLHGEFLAANKSGNTFEARMMQDAVNNFDALADGIPGKMYEVNINADPADFLDYDKPVTGRAREIVEEALRPTLGEPGLEEFWKRAPDSGEAYVRAERSLPPGELMKKMREAGIPGIRYLDQGSRAQGKGSSNYVIFDDSLIEILRKYGLAGLIPGGAAAAAMMDRPEEIN